MDITSKLQGVFNTKEKAQSAVRTVTLEREFYKKLQNGETLESIAMHQLPATSQEQIEEDIKGIIEGVETFYNFEGSEASPIWMKEHLNLHLSKLDNEHRIIYLKNLVNLISYSVEVDEEEWLSEEDMAEINNIQQKEIIMDEDVTFVLSMTQDLIFHYADVLKCNTIEAIYDMLPYISNDVVKEIADFGKETALAYALACYVMQEQGKTPWTKKGEESYYYTPYELGVIASQNVEESKLVALYAKGKVTLEQLHEKLELLYEKVRVFIVEHELVDKLMAGVTYFIWMGCIITPTLVFIECGPFLGIWALLSSLILLMTVVMQEDAVEVEVVENENDDIAEEEEELEENVEKIEEIEEVEYIEEAEDIEAEDDIEEYDEDIDDDIEEYDEAN